MGTVKGTDSNQEYALTSMIDQYQIPLLQMCFMYLMSTEQWSFWAVVRELPRYM